MVQQNSIPEQIVHFFQTDLADEAYFRGVGIIDGVPSTIVLALTDFAFISFEGNVAFNGQIRNPVEFQPVTIWI